MTRKTLKYLSICSGIEAATAAWHALGWQPMGFSEIDSFARAVLAHHYPDVPLHGDFTALKESDYAAIDLLVGGTPCQSFSVAGLRKGLADDRGNLSLEFIRLAEKSRARWLVWENVPGVLSIDGGRAFGTFLGGLAECGYGFAYRILDAQYFGVPQRRRRVFVVGYLGDWRPAAAVLFERESLRRDITPRREARQGATYDVAPSITNSGRGTERAGESRGQDCLIPEVAPTLDGRSGRSGEHSFATSGGLIAAAIPLKEPMSKSDAGAEKNSICGKRGDPMFTLNASNQHGVAHTLRGGGFDASEDGTGRGIPLLAFGGGNTSGSIDVAAGLNAKSTQRQDFDTETLIAFSAKDYGNGAAENIAPTLRAMTHAGSHQNGGGQLAVAIPLQEVGKRTGTSTDDASIGSGIGNDGDAMFTLQAAARHGVASFKPGQSAASRGIGYEEDIAPSLEAGGGGNNKPALMHGMAVRRLTPRECERLQGFPDDYTLVPFRGKPAADGNRYKALGNSMAVPVMRWLGERIQEIDGLIK
ncbi:MAG: DNA cytosine methyltransferase [Pseudomonadota bacterium]|nr:DNA cytosine methyltransferase [Pseudomonadota bacterium]MDE3037030.1 DNA cytosine methyltransferase [Pseudomonadota bacterium]